MFSFPEEINIRGKRKEVKKKKYQSCKKSKKLLPQEAKDASHKAFIHWSI